MVTQMLESEVFQIPRLSILPSPGSFAKISGVYGGLWYYCREEFHCVNQTTKTYLYSHRPGCHASIVAFIQKVEKMLKLVERSEFRRTQYNRVTWVSVSPWWRHSMRRSLFTILLRAGQNYDGTNFDETLFSKSFKRDNHYLIETEGAVRRFLRGYTWYTGRVQGWWDAFQGTLVWDFGGRYTRDSLEKKLVKPKEA